MKVMIDSLKAYDDLKKGDFSEEQTRGLVAVFQAVTEAVDSALEKRFSVFEKSLEKSLKAEIEKVKTDVIKWCVAVILAACAIGFGIIVNFLK